MRKRKRFHGFYEGEDLRRHQENQDSMMIGKDRSGFANLPQNVVMKYYSPVDYSMNEGLDDTVRGVDQQMRSDARGGKRKSAPPNPEKW